MGPPLDSVDHALQRHLVQGLGITGGSGDDLLSGGEGADQFVFSGAFGQDTVSDFEVGIDTLRFEGRVRAELTLSEDEGDVLIDTSDSHSVRLNGIELADFSENDLQFVSDGLCGNTKLQFIRSLDDQSVHQCFACHRHEVF